MTRPLPEPVLVGRIRRPHGVRGEVLVEVLSDVRDRFRAGRRLAFVTAAGERGELEVVAVRGHGDGLLLRLAGCEDRDRAETLRGARLEVAAADSPRPPEGAYYYYEIVGCSCRDRRAGELGEVTAVIEDGGGLLLEVVRPGGSLLVPFVRAYLIAFDRAQRRIELALPEGLIETCESRS